MKMQWRSIAREGEKVLYLQNGDGTWIHYSASKYALPDYDVKHSKGWATFQRLHKLGWKLIPSD